MSFIDQIQGDIDFFNTKTGEVIGVVRNPVDKNKKPKKNKSQFSMINNDKHFENFDFSIITNHKELILMMLLVKLQTSTQHYLTINDLHYEYLIKKLNITRKAVQNLIISMVKKDLLRRVCRNTYMVNPHLFYKGFTDAYEQVCFYWDTIKHKQDAKPLEEQESN